MASNLPVSLNGITYNAVHHSMSQTHYSDNQQVQRWAAQYWSGIDGYQRFIELARIQQGERVLDLACGVGLAGLLACEVIGGRAPSVYFVDSSMEMMVAAKTEAQLRHPDIPEHHFARLGDIRNPVDCRRLLESMKQPGGFDVVLAKLFVSHFTIETQPALLRHLRTLLKPGGRLVFDWGVPSPSRGFQGGQPSDEMVLGARKTRISGHWGQLPYWRMGTRLEILDFTTMVTSGDYARARTKLREIVEEAGGVHGECRESISRRGDGINNISQQIVTRANQNGQPPNQDPRVQQDLERRIAWDEIERSSVPGNPMTFRMMYGLIMVVKSE